MDELEAKDWVLNLGLACNPPYKPFGLGTCQRCGATGTWRRQNTAYAEDQRNFACYCDVCQEDANEYWKERWDEYWSGCM